jgi:hypothetical protein
MELRNRLCIGLWAIVLCAFLPGRLSAQLQSEANTQEKQPIGNPFLNKLKPATVNGTFSIDDHIVWGASVIQHDDGKYYMFASFWPGPMGNWVTHSQVALAIADKPEGPYEFKKVVLLYRDKKFWDGMMTHNPTIRKYKDTYYLFYIGVTFDFERPQLSSQNEYGIAWNNKRIGVATAKHPEGPWTRYDKPLIEPRAGHWDLVNTSNPAPVIHEDGSVTLFYKSSNLPSPERNNIKNKDGMPRFMLGVAHSKNIFGEYERLGNQDGLINLEGKLVSMEDPYVWFDGNLYHMLVKNFDSVGNAKGMGAIYVWSKDGVNWFLPSDAPEAYSLNVNWAEGINTKQVRLERPQIFFENGVPKYLFLATQFREEDLKYLKKKGNTYNVAFEIKK